MSGAGVSVSASESGRCERKVPSTEVQAPCKVQVQGVGAKGLVPVQSAMCSVLDKLIGFDYDSYYYH